MQKQPAAGHPLLRGLSNNLLRELTNGSGNKAWPSQAVLSEGGSLHEQVLSHYAAVRGNGKPDAPVATPVFGGHWEEPSQGLLGLEGTSLSPTPAPQGRPAGQWPPVLPMPHLPQPGTERGEQEPW